MSEIKNGGPAFPLADSGFDMIGTSHEAVNGATMRDYFAAKALVGLVAANNYVGQEYAETLAKDAYELADAMLHAREAT
jgi:hypothetical protein